MSTLLRTWLPVGAITAAVIAAAVSSPRRADAEPVNAQPTAQPELCATRLHIAMVGESAPAEALASTQPQAQFDALAKDPRFVERFSRFINSQLNSVPGATPAEDASYYMAKHVLTNDLPWSEMFVGKLKVVSMLESLPGVGKVKARKVMEEIGIADSRRVRGLGAQQRAALLEQLGK